MNNRLTAAAVPQRQQRQRCWFSSQSTCSCGTRRRSTGWPLSWPFRRKRSKERYGARRCPCRWMYGWWTRLGMASSRQWTRQRLRLSCTVTSFSLLRRADCERPLRRLRGSAVPHSQLHQHTHTQAERARERESNFEMDDEWNVTVHWLFACARYAR